MHTHMCINGGQGGHPPRSPTPDAQGGVKIGKKFEIVTKNAIKFQI